MSKNHGEAYEFLNGGGEIAELIKKYDWSKTSIGPISSWPYSLRTAINITLQSEVPIALLWGDDGVMLYNQAYAYIAGARHPDIIGTKVAEAWPEIADFNTNVVKTIKSGKTLAYLNQQMTLFQNGKAENYSLNLNYSPVMGDDGQPAGVFAIVTDVTQRIEAERKLASTRGQLDSALAVGLVSSWVWEINSDIVTGDKNLARSFGVTEEEMLEGLPIQSLLKAIHKEDRDRVTNAIQETIEKDVVFEQEYRTTDADGEERWVIARGQIQRTDTGEPELFVGIIIDITDRKIAQMDLISTKDQFDALFNSTIVAIAMARTDGSILQVNQTFLDLFGYTRTEFARGLTSQEVSAPSSQVTTTKIYDSIKRTGEAEPTEKVYMRKDGTTFPAIVGAAKLPSSKDTFIAFILDVSENQHLKDLNAAKDEFIALASHQLRTPASTVKQYLGLLLEDYAGPLSKQQLKYLATANKANDRQLSIINDLLKTAQIDTKGYKLALHKKDLATLVDNVISEYNSAVESRNQKIVFNHPSDSFIVELEETEMSICVSNLIENASKYSPDGTTITLSLTKKNDHVELAVTDQGVGIDKKDQDKIFEKFTRVDNKLSDTVTGSGLGLYWVKRIVDIHRGSIEIKSNVGKGTSFIVRLPI